MKSGIIVLALLLVASFGFAQKPLELIGAGETYTLMSINDWNCVGWLPSAYTYATNGSPVILCLKFTPKNLTYFINASSGIQTSKPEPKTECPKETAYSQAQYLYEVLKNDCEFVGFQGNSEAYIFCSSLGNIAIKTEYTPPPPEQFGDIYMFTAKALYLLFSALLVIWILAWLYHFLKAWIADIAEERMKKNCKNYKKKR